MADESTMQRLDGNHQTRGSLVPVPVTEVKEVWPSVRTWAAKSLPDLLGDSTDKAMAEIFSTLVSGKSTLWIGLVDGVACGGLITSVVPEMTGVKNLWISCFFMDPKANRNVIDDGMKCLSSYARKHGCQKVVAFSSSPAVLGFVKRLGGNVGTRFVQLEVK